MTNVSGRTTASAPPGPSTASGTAATENLKGAGWMTLGMAGYVINDVFIKLVAEDLPLFQAIFIRGVLITTIIGVWVTARGEALLIPKMAHRPVLVRIATEALATAAYLTALTKLPLAGLTAVMQVVPLAVTFAAARVLREPVSIHRITTVVAGFGGVLLIVRPWSDQFSAWFLLGLVAVSLIVTRELATRRIGGEIPTLVIALGTAVTITLMGLVVSTAQGWGSVSRQDLTLLGLAALFLTVGYLASVITVRVGELSFSAPFRYTVLLFAIVLQIAVFGETPDTLTFVGSAVIVSAGLWAFAHERVINAFVRRG